MTQVKASSNQRRGWIVSATILLLSLLAAFARSPHLLLHGRIVAEEGTDYLQPAWNLPGWHSFVQPHMGYYSLLDNSVAAIATSFLPLQWAGLVFTWSAMLVLLLMVYCFVTCEAFHTTTARALAAFLCVFCPSIEVWMTLEDAQFCLAAGAAIILVSDPVRHRFLRCFTLLLAGLSGPAACALAPFAILRAVRLRNRMAWVQAALLSACGLLQGALLAVSLARGSRAVAHPGKWAWVGPVFAVKAIALTFFSRSGYTRLMDLLRYRLSTTSFVLAWLLALLGLLAFAWIAKRGGKPGMWLFAMAIWSFFFGYEGVLDAPFDVLGGDNRYFYVTTLLLWTVVLLAWTKTRSSSRQGIQMNATLWPTLLLAMIFITGLRDARLYWMQNQLTAASWQQEVAHWRRDPHYALRVSPASWRPVDLVPHESSQRRGQ